LPLTLDRKDQRILLALSEDARQSLSAIGRKSGISEEVVKYRLKKLIGCGIIANFRAEIDYSLLGYKTYLVHTQLKGAGAKKEEEIWDYLKKHPAALWAGACEGKHNFAFHALARDELELNEILGGISDNFLPHVEEQAVATQIASYSYRGASGIFEKNAQKYRTPGRNGFVRVDEKDLLLLSMLSKNCRTPLSLLGKKLKLAPNSARYRIKQLEEKRVIAGYGVFADGTKLGMSHYKAMFQLKNASEQKIAKLAKQCESIPNLAFLNRSVGAWELTADFHFKSNADFHLALLEIASMHKDIIRSYSALYVLKSAWGNPAENLKAAGQLTLKPKA
jgi:DNA-binding Lrp family transcriptional regulator